ncbi:Uncharacterised protein [Suttonella ornithocola]|uniref:Methyltransferase domain n=2 Tax=Suttonella ornithocola TaxID=279832 RepID=A0A380MSZ8_9GAMM|nr:class I SAM-dependent methyltransferase [Suttonella ornithocola]SUO95186.1 Uncharacterised protein [Suttonella ornithocola]SUQ09755.1 Uncharacterised protein [Suttonella ornithocola]
MWHFDKTNHDVLFGDIRCERHTLCDGRNLEITPDKIIDYTNLPFDDDTFYLVVFDPPHLIHVGDKSWMIKKYGRLKNWETEIRNGFDECMRVLKPNGTLCFKWNEIQIPVSKILSTIGKQPIVGHKSGKASKTHWMLFLKDL